MRARALQVVGLAADSRAAALLVPRAAPLLTSLMSMMYGELESAVEESRAYVEAATAKQGACMRLCACLVDVLCVVNRAHCSHTRWCRVQSRTLPLLVLPPCSRPRASVTKVGGCMRSLASRQCA